MSRQKCYAKSKIKQKFFPYIAQTGAEFLSQTLIFKHYISAIPCHRPLAFQNIHSVR